MSEEVEFVICNNCDSPCYSFELDRKGAIDTAFCALCGADEAKDFRLPEVEDVEEKS